MRTWAKRGLQTALVTGGLLLLGTGIASADENVDPDRPASPLDGSIRVPIDLHDNAIGTPGGQIDIPDVKHEVKIGTDSLPKPELPTEQLPTSELPAADLPKPELPTQELPDAPAPKQLPAAPPAPPAPAVPDVAGDPAMGNQVIGDAVVPVEIAGNALALGGPAEVESTSKHSAAEEVPVTTDGSGGFLAGNVAALQWAAPVQITGNALGLAGDATATTSGSTHGESTGDLETSGGGGFLAGNILAGQAATPLQISGNAANAFGSSIARSTDEISADGGGALISDGEGGAGSGNVAGLPVAMPFEFNGQALSALGNADSETHTTAEATGGGKRPAKNDIPSYIHTSGKDGILAGTAAGGAISNPATVTGQAGSLAGNAFTVGDTGSMTEAGGFLDTTGEGGFGSGTVLNPNWSIPAGVISNALTGGGNVESSHDNWVDSVAGDGSYTTGNGGVGSGTNLSNPVAWPADVYANAGSVLGNANVDPHNDVHAQSGGYNGTSGDASLAGGNAGSVPIAGSTEGFGNAGTLAGNASTETTETKVSEAGGDTNTDDDAGVLAANIAEAAGGAPIQAFAQSVGVLGSSKAMVDSDSVAESGGKTNAVGVGGLGSGNIAKSPVSVPIQVLGNGGSAFGNAISETAGTTDSIAGDDASADGTSGAFSGNIFALPGAAAAHLMANSVPVAGSVDGTADHAVHTQSGGSNTAAGDSGTFAGNIVTGEGLGLGEGSANTVGALGNSNTSNTSALTGISGGDNTASGMDSTVSGNAISAPVGVIAEAVANIVTLGSNTKNSTVGDTQGTSGGSVEAVGSGPFSGTPVNMPVGVIGGLYEVPLGVLSNSINEVDKTTELEVGGQPAQVEMPLGGDPMGATELPNLANAAAMAKAPAQSRSAHLPDATNVAELDMLWDSSNGELPELPVQQQLRAPDAGRFTGELPTEELTSPIHADIPALQDLQDASGLSDWFFGMANKA
ncbi:MAG: hypothetical protein GEU98_08140 [Pseudonocardiaceae bacterium]|nr:hypothetical protein [Pseudonocardiaceae bacterium]